MENAPPEDITVEGRMATISTIVEPAEAGRLRVVVQGLMPGRLVPGHHVALDGFYKSPDGAVAPLLNAELSGYD